MFKTFVRKALEDGFYKTVHFFPKIKDKIKDRLSIFLFHDITDEPSEFCRFYYNLAVSTNLFKNQIAWIAENFNIIHPHQLMDDTTEINNGAMITFDDGFLGAFENGIPFLVENSIPSTMYLNMGSIIKKRPLISAILCYLDRYSTDFKQFAEDKGIKRPYSHTMTPTLLNEYQSKFGPCDMKAVETFQGPLATLSELKKWKNNDLVIYGNHLFDHWNSHILSKTEFIEQYKKNTNYLKDFMTSNSYFAFTNGQPGSCFTQREIDLLEQLGADKIFFSSGFTNQNPNSFLLDRIALGQSDDSNKHLWFRMLRLYLKRNNTMLMDNL